MIARDRKVLHLVLTAAGLQATFSAWPELDLAVSDLFRFGTRHFPLASDRMLALLRETLWQASLTLGVVVLAGAVIGLVSPRLCGPRGGPCPLGRAALFLILGPGVLVNGILKTHWGRMRPADVVELGGSGAFTPAFRMAGQCARNCSFVSGEAALGMAAALVLWNFAARAGRATPALRLVLGAAVVLTAGMRLATGRHFLSDVVFACLFMAIMAQILLPQVSVTALPPRDVTPLPKPLPRARPA